MLSRETAEKIIYRISVAFNEGFESIQIYFISNLGGGIFELELINTDKIS